MWIITLTTGVDAISGTSGNDTIISSQTALNAGDSLNGGTGTDTLAVNTNAATTFGAFTAAGIETIQATAIAGASTINLSNATGVTTVSNVGSDSNVTFDQLQSLATVSASNTAPVTGSLVNPNMTALFKDSLLTGTADAVKVNLASAKVGTLTLGSVTSAGGAANGVETIEFTTSSGASTVSTLGGAGSTGLSTIKVSGDQSLTITNALVDTSVKTIDASGMTAGGLTIDLTGNTQNVTVTGSAGNDDVTFNASLTSSDKYDGGAGVDTVRVQTIAQVDAADSLSNITNVEVLRFTTATSGTLDVSATGANAASVPASVTTYTFGAGLNGATVLNGLTTGVTVGVLGGAAGNNLTAALKTDGAADVLNLTHTNPAGANSTIGTLTATGFETLAITSTDADRTTNEGLIVTTLTDTNLKTLTVAGSGNVTISGSNAASLATVDANTATGDLSLNALGTASTTAMTITGGAGADALTGGSKADSIVGGAGKDTISGSVGADTMTGGDGADTFVYTAANQSGTASTVGFDNITDFVSGVDKLDLSNIGGNSVLFFKGVHATTTQAINALSGGSAPASGMDAVFLSSENALVVDVNDDGQIDTNDLYIKLNGVTTITATDLGVASSGNNITLTAAAAQTSTTANNANASAKTTAFDDTISSTIANLAGSTVTGGLGNDTLTLTDAGAVGAIPATVTEVETLVLATVGSTANTAVSLAGASIKSITGSSNADTVSITNLVAGGAVNLGGGVDNITGATEALVEGTGSTFVGGSSSVGGAADVDVLTFANGVATANLDLSSISGFETIDLGTVAAGAVTTTAAKFASGVTTLKGDTGTGAITVNMTGAQLDALTAITVGTGTNDFNVVVNDTGAYSVNLTDTAVANAFLSNINFAASSGATVTYSEAAGLAVGKAAAATALTFGAGADTFNINGVVASAGGRTYNLGGGADTVNVNIADGIVTATDLDATASTTSILNVNADVTTAGLNLQTNMNIFGTVNFTVDQVSGGNAVTINNGATTVTAKGGDFILGSGGDTFTGSGTAANVVTGGSGADTITFTNTAGNTVNMIASGGLDTINLNATNGVVDTIALNDGGGSVGLVLAADRFTLNGFAVANDIIRLDVTQTTVNTGAGVTPVIQSVSATGALLLASATADITVLNFDLGGSTAVLAGVTNGAALLSNLGGTMTAAANTDDGYILAYDNGNAYLYAFTNSTAAGVLAAEIALIGTINNVAVGSLGVANFSLGA